MRTRRVCSIAVLSALLCGSSAILLAQQPQQQQKLNSADLERAHMQVRLRVVSDAHDPKADIATLKTFAVESGKPGVVEA